MLRLSLVFALFLVCSAALSTTSRAQCFPVPGTGCFGDPPPTCLPMPGCPLPPPSSACGFIIDCLGSPFSLPCLAPPVILFGGCTLPGGPVPPPLGCSPLCTIVTLPSFGSAPSPMVVPPGLPVGFTFCAQCGCIARDPLTGMACINLSDAVMITVTP